MALKGYTPWNKGIPHSEETREKMRQNYKYHINSGCFKKGQHSSPQTEFKRGFKHSDDFKMMISRIHKDKITPLKTRKKMSKAHKGRYYGKFGEAHHQWKGGISKYHRIYIHRRRCLLKEAGELTLQIIQQVYEDNIKNSGTLTCYLCIKPIPFGKDHLEHKIPLSRGGTNAKDNLDIACQKCNNKKYNKTEEEYRKGIESYG